MLAQLVRFAGIGLLATLIHVAVAFAARYGMGAEAQAANLTGFFAAVSFSYFGHGAVTFQVEGVHRVHAPRFGLLAGLGLVLSSTITWLVTSVLGGSFALAMGLVAIAVPGATFLGSKFWVFVQPDTRTGARDLSGLALALGLPLLFFLLYQDRPINHDTAWYLVATRQWLDGARLYVDLIEVNPPLNFYLTVPAIWLADGLGLSDTNGQYLFLSGLCAASLIWVWGLLERCQTLTQAQRLGLLLAAAGAMMLPAGAFAAQREQVMMILIMPYLFGYLLSADPDRGGGALARAAVAAIGICIKPHFVLIPLALTFVRVVQTRRARAVLSPVNLLMFGVGLAYLGAVSRLHPEYFDQIVPLALLTYGDYGYGGLTVLRNLNPVVPLVFLILLVVMRNQGRARAVSYPAAAVFAGLAIYGLQWTGYKYQAIPVHGFALLGFAFVLILSGAAAWPGRLAIIGLALIGLIAGQNGFYQNPSAQALAPILRAQPAAPRLMVFSSSLWPGFPLALEARAGWTSRYPALWPLPGAVNGLARADCDGAPVRCAELQGVLEVARGQIIDDFERNAPNVLVFESAPRYFDEPFDYHQFLGADPRFADLLEPFEIIGTSERFVIWARSPS